MHCLPDPQTFIYKDRPRARTKDRAKHRARLKPTEMRLGPRVLPRSCLLGNENKQQQQQQQEEQRNTNKRTTDANLELRNE